MRPWSNPRFVDSCSIASQFTGRRRLGERRVARATRDRPPTGGGPPAGHVELVADAEHFTRIVRDGILTAKTSLDIATADFKAMLIPEPGTGYRRKAKSIVETFRRLAAG